MVSGYRHINFHPIKIVLRTDNATLQVMQPAEGLVLCGTPSSVEDDGIVHLCMHIALKVG